MKILCDYGYTTYTTFQEKFCVKKNFFKYSTFLLYTFSINVPISMHNHFEFR